MSDKKIVVSFASKGRENYNKAQLGLIKSCVNAGWDGDYLIRSYDGYCDNYLGVDIKLGSYPITEKHGLCPNHAEIPWGFKPDIIVLDSLTAVASAFTGKEDSYRIYIEQLFRFFERQKRYW